MQLEAGNDPRADQTEDRFAIGDRAPEVERRHVPREDCELLDIAEVGADPFARNPNLLGRGVGWQDEQSGVACCACRNKKDDHEEDQGDERLQHTTANVLDGNLPGWPLWRRYINAPPVDAAFTTFACCFACSEPGQSA